MTILDIIIPFGAALGFAIWQLWLLRKHKNNDKNKK